MSRTSRVKTPEFPTQHQWNPALYIRLSREDGDKEESDSVANQRDFLLSFVAQQEDMGPPQIYQDDGYSGTSFQRPDFQRMMEDAQSGRINCVIVKDLSRLGRNYIGVGEYLERMVYTMKLRFIAINDHLDSVKAPQEMNTILLPVKNILNDEYARDISNKVRSALDIKRQQGKFIGSFPSYGYQKDPQDKGKLVVDEPAAAVIRDIYRWFLEGQSILAIAKRLNRLGIPNPTAYKKGQGLSYRHPAGERLDGTWPDSSVRRILTNKLYTGTMVQGKHRIRSYKQQVAEPVPESQWIEVENTHQAIIDIEIFRQVQALLTRDRRVSPRTGEEGLFAGLLRCEDCGRAMHRKTIVQPYGTYDYYYCSTYKRRGGCTKHTIRGKDLEEAVLVALQQQIALAVEMDRLIAVINTGTSQNRQSNQIAQAQAQLEQKIQRVQALKRALYPDWKEGVLTRAEYLDLKSNFDGELDTLANQATTLAEEAQSLQRGVDGTNPFLRQFTQYRNLTHLDRPTLLALIHMIYVKEGGGIRIEFSFSDALQTAQRFLESNEPTKKPSF